MLDAVSARSWLREATIRECFAAKVWGELPNPFRRGESYEIVRALGYDEAVVNAVLAQQPRLKRAQRTRLFWYFIVSTLLCGLISSIYLRGMRLARSLYGHDNLGWLLLILLIGVTYGALFIAIMLATRVANTLVSRSFADVRCILAARNLLGELSREDALSNADRRRMVARRASMLSKRVRFLALTSGVENGSSKQFAADHFGAIGAFIDERLKWIVAPRPSTLKTLRVDFFELGRVVFLGLYGTFDWGSYQPVLTTPSGHARGIFAAIVALLLPAVLLLLILTGRVTGNLGAIDQKTTTLLLVAWFLLAIDARLKLGLVAGLAKLAKGIKELG